MNKDNAEYRVATIDPDKYKCILPPTRQCLICEKLEDENEDYTSRFVRDVGWICPSCAEKIGKLIGVRTISSSEVAP